MSVIESTGVVKRYGSKSVLNGFSLQVEPGEVCALAGPNGSGKTTFLRLVLGLAKHGGGQLRVLGAAPGVAHRRINYLCEDEAVYPHLSAADNLRVALLARGEEPRRELIGRTLDQLALGHTGRRRAGAFSLGMKRRLQFAMTSLVHGADLYILDEPTNGLDINGLLWLKGFLGELRERGAAVLLTTHALDDLQDSVTHLAILREGRVASKEAVAEGQLPPGEIQIEVGDEDVDALRRAFPRAIHAGRSAVISGLDLATVFHVLAANQIAPVRVDASRHSLSRRYLDALSEE